MNTGDYKANLKPKMRAFLERLPEPQAVYDAFRAPGISDAMIRLSDQGIPAVLAVEQSLLPLGPWVHQDEAKRVFGRLTKVVMAELGYTTDRPGIRTPDSSLFTKGMTYRPVARSANPPQTSSELEKQAVELVCLAAEKLAAVRAGACTPEDEAAIKKALEALT